MLGAGLVLFGYALCFTLAGGIAESSPQAEISEIMNRIEQRYSGSGMEATFHQTSTLKSMDITDTARGRLAIKRPGKMRWEYETPERQYIITDGERLWVYRPEDEQVLIGEAAAFFGEGKGAGFLSDIRLIERDFHVEFDAPEMQTPRVYALKLLPKKEKFDVALVRLIIRKKDWVVKEIRTINSYGDVTQIVMSNFQFNQDLDNALFHFTIPEGVEIVRIEN
jgi:outer membrane lipoprotein carrier protein